MGGSGRLLRAPGHSGGRAGKSADPAAIYRRQRKGEEDGADRPADGSAQLLLWRGTAGVAGHGGGTASGCGVAGRRYCGRRSPGGQCMAHSTALGRAVSDLLCHRKPRIPQRQGGDDPKGDGGERRYRAGGGVPFGAYTGAACRAVRCGRSEVRRVYVERSVVRSGEGGGPGLLCRAPLPPSGAGRGLPGLRL